MALGLKSNPVPSELILPTAFETAQCGFPTINRGRETALRCHLDYVDRATGNYIISYHVRSSDRDFCRGGFANNTCPQSPISKTRPDRDIMVNRSDMISSQKNLVDPKNRGYL